MVNSNEFASRLQEIIEYYDLTASSFADKIDVQRSSISHIISGRNKPSLDFIIKTIDAFPEVSLYWLLLNKGTFPSSSTKMDMLIEKNANPQDLFSEINTVKNTSPVREDKEKTIPENLSHDKEIIDRVIIFFKDGSFKDYQN